MLYEAVRQSLETWLACAREVCPDDDPIPAWVEEEFRRYLTCGILAHGFARASCPACGHNFLVAFSCKGGGVCPSCNTRRMAETAAHLVDNVFTSSACASVGARASEAVALLLAPRPGVGRALARGRTPHARAPAAQMLCGGPGERAHGQVNFM